MIRRATLGALAACAALTLGGTAAHADDSATAEPPRRPCVEGLDMWTIPAYSLVVALEYCSVGPMDRDHALTLFLLDGPDAQGRCDRMGGSFEEIGERGRLHLTLCHGVDK